MINLKWQHKLFLIALVISVVPILFISSNMIGITEESLTSSVNEELGNAANSLAKDINTFFVNNHEKISLVKRGIENEELGLNEKLSLLVAGIKDIDDLLISSLVFESGDGEFSQALQVLKESDNSTANLSSTFENLVISYYSEIHELKDNKKKIGTAEYINELGKWITFLIHDINLQDAPKGYLISILDLTSLLKRINSDKFNLSGNLYIVDSDTNYILSEPSIKSQENIILSDAVEMLSATSRASGVTNFKRGDETIVASFAFPRNIDWAIISEMSEEVAYEPVAKMNSILVYWIIGGLLLAGLGVILFTNIIGKPIHLIASKANEIAKGNFDISIDYKPNDSLGLLGNSLLLMSSSLKESFLKIESQNRQLEEYNKTLEDKVKERTLALKKTNDDLQKAYLQVLELNKEKNEFLGIAAHDLKNPLAAIKGFGSIILDDPEMDRTEIDEFAESIVSSSERMFSIITSLLDINKIEEGKIVVRYDTVYLTKTVREIVLVNRENAKRKNIKIEFESDDENISLENDRDLISQIVDNLLSNAVKFSESGKNVQVRVNKTSNSVYVSVKDQGPGLSEKDKKNLFGKFAKLSAQPTGGENSTGLGLSIVKKLTELIDADIKVNSEQGKGAEFIVSFSL